MKRVTDIISEFISAKGIEDVFMVSGGGLLFLTDGLYKNEKLNKVCCHHEQAAAMAAVGYAKYKGIGCAYITTGCGGTNAMTGLLNAYQDNTPCIFISGQVKRKESTRYRNLDIRQLGVQEADIVSIVEHITKYAVMLTEAEDVYYELEKAYHTAISGRPGPVWIDVPMDVQGAVVDETKLRHFVPEDKIKICATEEEISILKSAFEHAKRPIIVAGQGVRLSKAIDEFQKFVERYEIPFVASRLGTDVLPTENPLFIGRIGNKGTRAGNFAVQNADFVLALGSRLSVSSTGHEYEYFAREAKIFAVDIDTKEHKKGTVRIDKEINCDIKEFLKNFDIKEDIKYSEWAKICLNWKNKYPVALEEYKKEERVNLFTFINELSKRPGSFLYILCPEEVWILQK